MAFSVWKEPSRELTTPAGACRTLSGVGRQAGRAPGPSPDLPSRPARGEIERPQLQTQPCHAGLVSCKEAIAQMPREAFRDVH